MVEACAVAVSWCSANEEDTSMDRTRRGGYFDQCKGILVSYKGGLT
jgi:hypothetical protein